MKKFYKIANKNKIIHLPSVRDVTLPDSENRVYISYQNGDIRTEVLTFTTRHEAEEAFEELSLALTQEVD